MRSETKELLYFLLWSANQLYRPTWCNLDRTFERWAWSDGLPRRLATLSQQKLIERHPDLSRVVRLTQVGWQTALGGRDPAARWKRRWDGAWRLVLFDVPVRHGGLRQQLRRTLRRLHFGYLQRSVWISPDPVAAIAIQLRHDRVESESFLIVEGRPAAGESDAEIVAGAWDFSHINRLYERYLSLTRKAPPAGYPFLAWSRRENTAWKTALASDPLLPAALLPAGYLGREALERRRDLVAQHPR